MDKPRLPDTRKDDAIHMTAKRMNHYNIFRQERNKRPNSTHEPRRTSYFDSYLEVGCGGLLLRRGLRVGRRLRGRVAIAALRGGRGLRGHDRGPRVAALVRRLGLGRVERVVVVEGGRRAAARRRLRHGRVLKQ